VNTRRAIVVAAIGTTQTIAWASSYYMPAILGAPIASALHLPTSVFFGLFSGALLLSAAVGPIVGRLIDRHGGRVLLAASNLVIAAGLVTLAAAHGIAGLCLVFAPMLEALGTHINLGLPLRIGGILAVALAVAAAVQIEEWVMCAQVALGLGLFGLGCFGPTDAIVDIFSCCVFGFLIAFLAAMQAENFKAGRR